MAPPSCPAPQAAERGTETPAREPRQAERGPERPADGLHPGPGAARHPPRAAAPAGRTRRQGAERGRRSRDPPVNARRRLGRPGRRCLTWGRRVGGGPASWVVKASPGPCGLPRRCRAAAVSARGSGAWEAVPARGWRSERAGANTPRGMTEHVDPVRQPAATRPPVCGEARPARKGELE
ncbi:spermatogenesis-associated protein 33 [Sapajus apella]|uniref:Spermatogenesis-associated protein 33 n=1 Tax=Sapajus apella TaxID=9515 RepID=A0A6J3IF44_SAPAP|nr:spermatogenesis-associated protein 33 [Sapajus apella]